MNLKALKERKEALLDELEVMVSGLESEGEIRALSAEEREAFDKKEAEIKDIDATIERIERRRAEKMGTEAVEKFEEERSKEVNERRALENFFRGMDLEAEERTLLASTSSNQALMPLEISKTIMQKLEEQCPILEEAKRFSSKGTIRLIKEKAYGQAGVTAENTAFKNTDVEFEHIELRAFKVTAMCHATFEMLQNSEIDLTNYLLDVIVRRLSRELNKLFLKGTGTSQPKGLITEGIEHEIQSELTVNDFITMQTKIHPDYLNGAVWLVGRDTFTKMANLLDGNGRPYLIANFDTVNNKIAYSFLGLKVVVDNNMDGLENEKIAVAMANIGEAYAINVLTDITVRHLTETGFTQGFETFAGYVMVDGKVINADAIVLGKVKNSMSRAKK